MPHDLPKAYDPTAIEDHWAEYWVRENLFAQPTPEPATASEASARLDGKSGEELYRERLGATCNSSPIASDGHIFLSDNEGKTFSGNAGLHSVCGPGFSDGLRQQQHP